MSERACCGNCGVAFDTDGGCGRCKPRKTYDIHGQRTDALAAPAAAPPAQEAAPVDEPRVDIKAAREWATERLAAWGRSADIDNAARAILACCPPALAAAAVRSLPDVACLIREAECRGMENGFEIAAGSATECEVEEAREVLEERKAALDVAPIVATGGAAVDVDGLRAKYDAACAYSGRAREAIAQWQADEFDELAWAPEIVAYLVATMNAAPALLVRVSELEAEVARLATDLATVERNADTRAHKLSEANRAIAAKDARIAELEAALRWIADDPRTDMNAAHTLRAALTSTKGS